MQKSGFLRRRTGNSSIRRSLCSRKMAGLPASCSQEKTCSLPSPESMDLASPLSVRCIQGWEGWGLLFFLVILHSPEKPFPEEGGSLVGLWHSPQNHKIEINSYSLFAS